MRLLIQFIFVLESTSASSSNIAIIIGAVVGVVLLLVCIMLLVYFFLLKPNRNFKEEKYLTPKNTNDNNRLFLFIYWVYGFKRWFVNKKHINKHSKIKELI